MIVRIYSRSMREKLHPPGVPMRFGGGTSTMTPEAAARLAHGLVTICRETGYYRRAQVAPVDERLIIEEALQRDRWKHDDAVAAKAPRGNRLHRR